MIRKYYNKDSLNFYSHFYFFSNFYFYFITKNQTKMRQKLNKALPSVKLSKKDSDDNSNGNVNNQHFLSTWDVLNEWQVKAKN